MDEQRNPLKGELKFLERLSIEELEALLKFSGDPDDVELLFDTVVEEVVTREKENPTGRLPDVDTAWDELQMMYHNMPDAGTLPLSSLEKPASLSSVEADPAPSAEPVADKPRRVSFQKVMRTAAAMAAAIVLSLALMVGAQAAGVDVFGVLARWTDETFHFETWSAEPTYCEALHDAIQDTLDAQGILGAHAPTWFPVGFEIESTNIVQDSLGLSIQIILMDNRGSSFSIGIDKYKERDYIDPQIFEIEGGSVKKHESNGKDYYIFTNEDSITASWSDGLIVYTIWGELEEKSMEQIIDSIGG